MRIAIVDDDMEFTKKVETTVVNFCDEVGEEVMVRRFQKGCALLKELGEKKNYDVYILDVVMPELDGLELARKIRETEGEANIVFLSSFEKYALLAYKVRAYDYIMKEKYKDEVPLILDKMRKEKSNWDEYYSIQTINWIKRVRFDEILYLDKVKKYVVFYCTGGRTYRERVALEEVYQRLPHERFIYINKGCIINMKHVTSFKKDVIGLNNDEVIHIVSRGMAPKVRGELARYWRK